ncbi:hypothetical protein [Pseudoflavonifractor sp. 524-17]|uniref:hypothetical protein n=1 Tax=Pseudoflavonifractor sp. 524-17 TaxID=2304577 RepID=UPI001FADD689|nr:hypothetical protein [Pseudoflavonifractor sp. 524-17]
MADRPQVRFFLGANAPTGFYSLYDQLIDPAQAADYYLLKGGPGCGKSTLMRQVGAALEARGVEVEYIQCSGDPDSLDAIAAPALGSAIVDATAPHVVEPQYPGVVERYVNLGDCYDSGGLQAAREEILSCMKGYKGCYSRAYRCLTAAAQIEEDSRALLLTPAVEERLAKRARGILSRECRRTGGEPGQARQRFLDAISCQGALCNFETADALCKRIYELCDTYGLAHTLLLHLAAGAMGAGYDVILCPDPLAPDRLRHLLIPSLSLGFVSSSPAQPYRGKRPFRRLRLDAMAGQEQMQCSRSRLRFARKIAAALIDEAVDSMAQAKEMHDHLEALYNPYVDFDRVHAMAGEIADRLLKRLDSRPA